MPYIEKCVRELCEGFGLSKLLENITGSTLAGVLNYIITKILLKALGKTPNYTRFNEIIGVLECCKLELYRRQVVPYEEKKIQENGDLEEKEKGEA